MPTRNATATWNGPLKNGSGKLSLGSKQFEGAYSYDSRFQQGSGTNPEELIAAAHAGCFTMALAHVLAEAGHPAEEVRTDAKVHLEKSDDGFSIPTIELATVGRVPGIDAETFQQHAEQSKRDCPVSKVLSGAKITLKAKLSE